jgi:hypothetical protein
MTGQISDGASDPSSPYAGAGLGRDPSISRKIALRPSGGRRDGNYFPVVIRARSTCSQSAVERVIKATSVEFSGFKSCNGKLRTGIRTCGSNNCKRTYQRRVLLRVIPYRKS